MYEVLVHISVWIITHRDDVTTQAMGCICTFNHSTELGVPHPSLLASGTH